MPHKTVDEHNKLETKLLSIGGVSARDIHKEDFVTQLNKQGKLIIPDAYEFFGMELGQCHRNSALLYQCLKKENNHRKIKIIVGWGLNIAYVWCQHTWLYAPRINLILETTLAHRKYFGYTLTNKETQMFQSIYMNS